MDKEIQKEARKQYFHYYRVWFIIIGVLAVICLVAAGVKMTLPNVERGNNEAPTERVFDYADTMTAEEEDNLRAYIAKCEKQYHFDIVLVTVSEDMEAQSYSWDDAMMNYADDFYDQNNFGYDKVHGDGVLLLDNWYEGQKGSWLSTCGAVYGAFGDYEVEEVLGEVNTNIDSSPYEAYKAYVQETCNQFKGGSIIPWSLILFAPIMVAFIYAVVNLRQKSASDTTNSKTYVVGSKPVMNNQSDDFIRKSVITRHIDTSSGNGGGGGGGHTSSGGVSHGGGGSRR